MLSLLLKRGFSQSSAVAQSSLKRTSLYDAHLKWGGKMVPFAGWEMPVQYKGMSIAESAKHTRIHASLFDVSHMLQLRVRGFDRREFLQRVTVADLDALSVNDSTLTVFTNENGGIKDDLIINKQTDHYYIVSNAACAEQDLAHLHKQAELFGKDVRLEVVGDTSLLALQGPVAHERLQSLQSAEGVENNDLSEMPFMTTRRLNIAGIMTTVSRSGYTGEDGFEIQVSNDDAVDLAELLLLQDGVEWAGLGARDCLRLEAGMCLYGHDLDETTSPVEGGLSWVVPKSRRETGGFLGDSVIKDHFKNGVLRRRVGMVVEGAPAREGALIFSTDGEEIGKVTSGVPSPNTGTNIAMGYVKSGYHKRGSELLVQVRKKRQSAKVVKMPFVETKYYKLP